MNNLNGFILLNKSNGLSSHKAILPIKKLLPKGYKIGHTGTLDPEATGLLPIAIGRATKFIQYLKSEKKNYLAGVKFGIKTDTADIWGNVIDESSVKVSEAEFENSMRKLTGDIYQIPPMYSALKKDGKPLYEYARKGIEIKRDSRLIHIYSSKLLSFSGDEALIEVTCSAGTYIRTLIEDLAKESGALACMNSLERKASDGFRIENSICINKILSTDDIKSNIISISEAFKLLPFVTVDDVHSKHIKNGVKVDLNRFISENSNKNNDMKLVKTLYRVVDYNGNVIALAEKNGDQFLPILNV